MNLPFSSRVVLLAGLAPLAFSAMAADTPQELAATATYQTGGPFFLTWRGTRTHFIYRIESQSRGTDDQPWQPVGETGMPHWFFDTELSEPHRFRVQGCSQDSECSDWALSDWLVMSPPDSSMPVGPGSLCGPANPPEEAMQLWEEHYRQQLEEASELPLDEDERSPDIDPQRRLLDGWEFAEVTEAPNHNIAAGPLTDADEDCLLDENDPDPSDSDTDDDGWFDGACNTRINLVLTGVKANDETEDLGRDEFYLIVDKARFPNKGGANEYWSLDDNDSRETEIVVATRTRGILRNQSLARVSVFGMEDDTDPFGNWHVDDTIFSHELDLDDFDAGQSFQLTKSGNDYSYVLTFRIDVEAFADPDIQEATADRDGDGITDQDEAAVAQVFGGLADPHRMDIIVEVDNFRSSRTYIDAMRQVHTAFARKGVALYTLQTQMEPDNCLDVAEVRDHYSNSFDFAAMRGVRYAMLASDLYNDRSGVAYGRSFISSRPTVRFGLERAIAGTFMHELGHTLGLVQRDFHLIDDFSPVNLGYRSSMTYFYQPLSVTYSSEQGGGGFTDDFDDWEHISVDSSATPQANNQPGFELDSFGFATLQQPGSDACQ